MNADRGFLHYGCCEIVIGTAALEPEAASPAMFVATPESDAGIKVTVPSTAEVAVPASVASSVPGVQTVCAHMAATMRKAPDTARPSRQPWDCRPCREDAARSGLAFQMRRTLAHSGNSFEQRVLRPRAKGSKAIHIGWCHSGRR